MKVEIDIRLNVIFSSLVFRSVIIIFVVDNSRLFCMTVLLFTYFICMWKYWLCFVLSVIRMDLKSTRKCRRMLKAMEWSRKRLISVLNVLFVEDRFTLVYTA